MVLEAPEASGDLQDQVLQDKLFHLSSVSDHSNKSPDLESLISVGVTGTNLVEASFSAICTSAMIRSCESALAEGFSLAWFSSGGKWHISSQEARQLLFNSGDSA